MIELKCRKNSSLKVQVRSVPLIKQKRKQKTNKKTQTKIPLQKKPRAQTKTPPKKNQPNKKT